MRYFDEDDAKRVNAESWQLALLNHNPSYCSWGPHEDYMWKEKGGWDSRQIVATWAEFVPDWGLNDLNECVNFYFEVTRASEDCKTCGGNGYHPDAQWISESFYRHSSPFTHSTVGEEQAKAVMQGFGSTFNNLHGRGAYPTRETFARYGNAFREFCEQMRVEGTWADKLTPDEYQALRDAGRTWDGPIGHDAINRWILVKARCKRLGVPATCSCDGHGYTFTEPAAHVSLVLWWLHPRKGCSRGIEITRIERDDLPAIKEFLTNAAQRNAERFKGIAEINVELGAP